MTGQLIVLLAVSGAVASVAVKRLAVAALKRTLRARAALACALLAYTLFYGVWGCFNYLNDRFYALLPSQLFFLLTELVPAATALAFADARDSAPHPAPLLASACVCLVHIVRALLDSPTPALGLRIIQWCDVGLLAVFASWAATCVGGRHAPVSALVAEGRAAWSRGRLLDALTSGKDSSGGSRDSGGSSVSAASDRGEPDAGHPAPPVYTSERLALDAGWTIGAAAFGLMALSVSGLFGPSRS